jgi:LPXTG-motif cell wall-anchored protein
MCDNRPPVGRFLRIMHTILTGGNIHMKRLVAGLVIAFCATLLGLAAASPAQAYPDARHTPATPTSPPAVTNVPSQAAAPSSSSSLPNTGGPDALLLGGGVALVVVGGAAIVVARRRRSA